MTDSLAALRDQRDGREKQIAEHLRRQRPAREVERQALADECVKQQELGGQVGKRVAGRVVGPGGAEMKRAGKRQVEGKRGEMQRIDAGEATPEEAADRRGIVDAAEILAGDDEAGDHKEQIDEQIEMPGVGDHETADRVVLEVIGIVKDHYGAGRNDPQPILMPCGAAVMQGCGTPNSNSSGGASVRQQAGRSG